MNRIKRKLRSEQGASITFALLLFLVCAIISSVVIVAGTTASGRLSGMSENEQAYYAVTSAAKVIEEVMKDGQVTAVTLGEGEHAETYYITGDTGKTTPRTLPERIVQKLESIQPAGDIPLEFKSSSVGDVLGKAVTDMDIKAEVRGDEVDFSISKNGYTVYLSYSCNQEETTVNIDGSGEVPAVEYTWNYQGAKTMN